MNAIEVRNVSKAFRLPHERHTTLVERFLSIFRPVGYEIFPALTDVTIDVPAGGFVGVLGANGSGKSTLLKLMAGLLVPDEGAITVNGSLTPLLELGLGFHQELSVSENIVLYGAVIGYPPDQMAQRVEEVVSFAELERFRDAKLKSLSSGMLMRLAFATALRAESDILLLDEVLAVGDARFQQKCFATFAELKKRRRTIILVSHDLASIQSFCDRVFWLDRGRIVMSGEPEEVVKTYLAIAREDALAQASGVVKVDLEPTTEEIVHRWGKGDIRFGEGRLETPEGEPLKTVRSGERVVLHLLAEVHAPVTNPVFGFSVKRLGALGGHVVYATNNAMLRIPSGAFAAGDRVDIRMPFTAALVDGHYSVHVATADGATNTIYDWINDYVAFHVEDSRCVEGIADLVADFHCDNAR